MAQAMLLTSNTILSGQPLLQSLKPKPFSYHLLPRNLPNLSPATKFTSPVALFKSKAKAPVKKVGFSFMHVVLL